MGRKEFDSRCSILDARFSMLDTRCSLCRAKILLKTVGADQCVCLFLYLSPDTEVGESIFMFTNLHAVGSAVLGGHMGPPLRHYRIDHVGTWESPRTIFNFMLNPRPYLYAIR